MEEEKDFYTVTMAKVYADQGYWNKAAEIYRHLLKQEPDREEYLEALAEAEKKMEEFGGHKTIDDLVPLFRRWFDLMLKYRSLIKLRQLKS
jgi:tetratricopeptide (TPR) repeat protein